MKKGIGLLIIIITVSLYSFGQPDNATVETVNGKKYYVHIVESGNTLYGIHQLYKTDLEDILEANEGLSNDLTLGQKILIPIQISDGEHYSKHKVKQGETLYGISKKYNCSINDLKGLNNGLTEGLSVGQEIIVPKKEQGGQASEIIQTDPILKNDSDNQNKPEENNYIVTVKDSIIEHTVLAHETLYSIAKRYMVSADTIMVLNGMRNSRIKKGKILKIPVKQVNYEVIEKDLTTLTVKDSLPETVDQQTQYKEVYNVALMLPLMLDKNDREMAKNLRIGEVREMYGVTKIAFEFYEGFLLAADSLIKAGVNVNIYVYDTKRDTATIGKYFRQSEFDNMDLVVGPLYRKTIKFTTKLCAKRKIRIVLPFNSDADILYQNPYVYKGVPSNMTLLDGTVDYIIENHKQDNIIIIKPTSTADLALYERVRERFNQKIKGQEGAYNLSIVETSLGSTSGRDLNNLLKKEKTNIFIVPSTSIKFVSEALGRLNKVVNMNPYSKKLEIISYGLEEWNKYDAIDYKFRNSSNQHYASYRFIDYSSQKGIDFTRIYRNNYGTDPTVYAIQGFDYGMYFLSALHLYGTNFDMSIEEHQMDLIQNEFKFRTIQDGSGHENQRVRIVKYSDYKLILVD